MARIATEKQKEASRRNGARSRGPKTAAGKAQSSMNAFKHGRYATLTCVMREEDPEAFKQYQASLMISYQPASDVEAHLVETIAAIDWRLTRLCAMETRTLDIEIAHHIQGLGLDPAVPDPVDRMALGGASLNKRSSYLQYLSMHENRMISQRASLQRQLFALQDRRPASQAPFRMVEPRPYDPAFFSPPENTAEVIELKPVNPEAPVLNEPDNPAPEPPSQLAEPTPVLPSPGPRVLTPGPSPRLPAGFSGQQPLLAPASRPELE